MIGLAATKHEYVRGKMMMASIGRMVVTTAPMKLQFKDQLRARKRRAKPGWQKPDRAQGSKGASGMPKPPSSSTRQQEASAM